jgi:cytochrome P450
VTVPTEIDVLHHLGCPATADSGMAGSDSHNQVAGTVAGSGYLDPFIAVAPGQRHAAYRALAEGGAPGLITTPDGTPAWLITTHAHVRQVLTDPRLVKAESPTTALTQRLVPELSSALVTHMLRFDGPDHTRLRGLVGSVFTRRRVEHLGPRIQQIADTLLDELLYHSWNSGGVIDLIPTFAFPLPMTVICEMIGLPEQDRDDFRDWTSTLADGYFADPEEFADAASHLLGFVRELVAGKRLHPGDDLLSALVRVSEDGDRLIEDELTSMVWLLVVAGHETTVNLIASAVHALLTHPDQLARLQSQPELIDSAVEEVLRVDGSLHTAIPMRARETIELAGVTIAAGQIVIPALMAADNDPTRVSNPEMFDIGRRDNPHMAFGHGLHFCLGAPLARLEARIALSSLLSRFPNLRLAVPGEQLRWRENFLIHGLTALPLILGSQTSERARP